MLNKATLIGRVGKVQEVRYSANGKKVVNFSLATSERYKDKSTGEPTERTEWHNIVCFDKLADIVETHLNVGSLIYAEGTIRTTKYPKNGVDVYSTKIEMNTMKMLSGKHKDEDDSSDKHERDPASKRTRTPLPRVTDDLDDDIPF
jgi:single-strand DNA-binding protein